MDYAPPSDSPLPFEQLCGKLGHTFPAITNARRAARETESKIRDCLAQVVIPPDLALVAFGSLARWEWTAGSDVDWTLLVDGPSDPEHLTLAQDTESRLKDAAFPGVGTSGTFGSIASSFDLIHYVGGSEDSNQNMTRRILLLLESVSLSDTLAHDRVLRGILKRYIQSEPSVPSAPNSNAPPRIPLFLLNDVVRLWRTIAVDYATKKRQQANEKWALRNIKLRMSRKLLFVKGLLLCYSCRLQPLENIRDDDDETVVLDRLVSHCRHYAGKTAIDALAEILLLAKVDDLSVKVLQAYDEFLACIDDPDNRKHLKDLDFAEAGSDRLFGELREISRGFRDGLNELFFDHPLLQPLTRRFGLF